MVAESLCCLVEESVQELKPELVDLLARLLAAVAKEAPLASWLVRFWIHHCLEAKDFVVDPRCLLCQLRRSQAAQQVENYSEQMLAVGEWTV